MHSRTSCASKLYKLQIFAVNASPLCAHAPYDAPNAPRNRRRERKRPPRGSVGQEAVALRRAHLKKGRLRGPSEILRVDSPHHCLLRYRRTCFRVSDAVSGDHVPICGASRAIAGAFPLLRQTFCRSSDVRRFCSSLSSRHQNVDERISIRSGQKRAAFLDLSSFGRPS